MKTVYINSIGSISSQKTFDNSEFLDDIISYEDNVISVVNPSYRDYISPGDSRRMSKGIKMGIVASKIALNDAGLETVDAIIIGTGMGLLKGFEKFLKALLDNNEQFLTPTSFIQSTHNTIGGQIALGLKCKGYNFTYVHDSISFESAMLDAKLMLENNEANVVLVGGVDEIGDYTAELHKLIHHIKTEKVHSAKLLKSQTEGVVYSEGANFFVLSNERQNTSYAVIEAIKTYNTLGNININKVVSEFLKENNLDIETIDIVVLGNNGDITHDYFYNDLSAGIFNSTQQVYYKHLCGEFNTASSFGVWLASNILKTQKLPEAIKLNTIEASKYKTILLYNQYRGENHSLTLLHKC